MLRFSSRFQADFWLISEWIEPFEWVGMLRFRQEEKITITELLESEDNQEKSDAKFNRVDIKAINSKEENIIVEVQLIASSTTCNKWKEERKVNGRSLYP